MEQPVQHSPPQYSPPLNLQVLIVPVLLWVVHVHVCGIDATQGWVSVVVGVSAEHSNDWTACERTTAFSHR